MLPEPHVAALQDLAATFEFGTLADDMILYQLVEHVSSYHICERLLLELDLTLD